MAKKIKTIFTVIPARGGSKSIPHKNIKLLNGRYLIDYSIQYSLKCPLVSHTVVSTDSEEIATISRKCGAEVPYIRPSELAKDLTPDYSVVEHALRKLENIYDVLIDIIVLLRPTSPLRPPFMIEKGIQLLQKFPNASSVRSVSITKEHPFRQWKLNGDFMVGYENKVLEPYNIPRQLLPSIYFQTGDIEIIRRETLLNGSISGENILPLIIQPEDMVDIDDMSDWFEAEKKIKDISNGKI